MQNEAVDAVEQCACGIPPSGDTLSDYGRRLSEFDNFVTRDQCGDWIPQIMNLHFWGDVGMAWAFLAISITVLVAWIGWRVSIFPNRWIAFGFVSYTSICGIDHILSAMAFETGIYDWQAITKGVGSFVSISVAVAVVWWTALSYRENVDLAKFEFKSIILDEIVHASGARELEEVVESTAAGQVGSTGDLTSTLTSVRKLAEATTARIREQDLTEPKPNDSNKHG